MDADAAAAPCWKPASRSLPQPALFAARSRSRVAYLGAGGTAFSSPSDTPPRCSNVAVPFQWEEEPGMPKAAAARTACANAGGGHQDSGHADQARRPVPLKLPPRLQQVPAPSFAAAADAPLSPKTVFQVSGGGRSRRQPPRWARTGGAAFRRTTSAGVALLSRTLSKTAAAAAAAASGNKSRGGGGGDHDRHRYAAGAGPDAPWCSPASSFSSSSVSTCCCGDDHGRWRPAEGREVVSTEEDDVSPRITRNWSVPSMATFNLWGDSLHHKMAPKRVVAATVATFEDELSIVVPPVFTKAPSKRGNRGVHAAVKDDGSKRRKSLASRKALKKKCGVSPIGREKAPAVPTTEITNDSDRGVSADAQLACGLKFQEIGLLPYDNAATLKFTEFCNKAFASPEVERDLLGVGDSDLIEAANYHLVSTLLLNQSLHHRNQLYHRNNDVVAKDDRIKELEEELEDLRKKSGEEKTARKAAEEASAKLKEELAEMRKSKEDETTYFVAAARELMGRYRKCLRGVGGDIELPEECTPASFISWLRSEISALEGHMMLGWDFSAIAAFKAICMGLLDAGCNHVENLTVHDVDHYWRAPSEANLIGKRFFNEFWLAGANDMAIMKGIVRLPRRNSRSAKW